AYTNVAAQTMLLVLLPGDTSSSSSSSFSSSSSGGLPDGWFEAATYDSAGRALLHASSDAVASIDESTASLFTLKPADGLIRETTWFGSGDGAGHLRERFVRKGAGGGAERIMLLARTYTPKTVGSDTVVRKATETVYRSDAAGGSDPVLTRWTYCWHPGTLQPERITTLLPPVPVVENGTNSADTREEVFDLSGNNTWSRNELGSITRTIFDGLTGAAVERIDDVNTTGISCVPCGWSNPGGLNLVNDFENDPLGRQTQALGPPHTADINGTATTVRTARFSVYRCDLHETWTADGYATGSAPGYEYVTLGPVSITRRDADGRVLDQIVAHPSGAGRLAASDSFPQETWLRWSNTSYDNHGFPVSGRAYFLIPGSGEGLNGANYVQTGYGHDAMGRPDKTLSPGGSVVLTGYDARGLKTGVRAGTDDSPGASNNMVVISANLYDGGAPRGNGLLTSLSLPANGPGVAQTRVSAFGYDWRGRQTLVIPPAGARTLITCDNLDRPVKRERWTSSGGALLRKTESLFDTRGRQYGAKRFAEGSAVVFTASNTWYDAAGQPIKQQGAGSLSWTKTVYNGVGRAVKSFLSFLSSGTTDGGCTNSVANDTVVEQTVADYDAASNLTATRRFLRLPGAVGTGELNYPGGANPTARVHCTCQWRDALGRVVATADYGTNGGVAVERPALIPAAGDTVLVSRLSYTAAGETFETTDPQGTVSRSNYDNLGRAAE
ncbi:MAG: hypothetical protein WCK77_25665, partial [Verrucomicrobiota bacterium]